MIESSNFNPITKERDRVVQMSIDDIALLLKGNTLVIHTGDVKTVEIKFKEER